MRLVKLANLLSSVSIQVCKVHVAKQAATSSVPQARAIMAKLDLLDFLTARPCGFGPVQDLRGVAVGVLAPRPCDVMSDKTAPATFSKARAFCRIACQNRTGSKAATARGEHRLGFNVSIAFMKPRLVNHPT